MLICYNVSNPPKLDEGDFLFHITIWPLPFPTRQRIYIISLMIQIYTDGSSLGNPGPGGFCAIIKTGAKEIIVKGGTGHTTNNRMEMSGIIAGLYWIHKNLPKEKKCSVFSDSNLIIQSILKGWKRKKNLDLWAKLDNIISKFDEISWHWVKGHAGHKENTKADKIAVEEAIKRTQKTISPQTALRFSR